MQLTLFLLCLTSFGLVSKANLFGRRQKVAVEGQLFCPKDPKSAQNVKVKLVDEDDGPDPDDHMAETRTDNEGRFYLEGEESELTNIDPEVKIYHDCNDHGRPCQRKWKFKVPDIYINSNKVMNLGRLNLEAGMDEEERDCIH